MNDSYLVQNFTRNIIAGCFDQHGQAIFTESNALKKEILRMQPVKEKQVGLLGRGKRDTNSIGDISEATIIARFLQLGYVVLTVHGGNQRYDLVIEDADGQFWRVQCKTARIEDNGTVVAFDTANHNYALKNKQARHYRGQCDYFAAYCEKLDKVYLIPVDQVGTRRANLRLVPAKNNQVKNVRLAQDYEL